MRQDIMPVMFWAGMGLFLFSGLSIGGESTDALVVGQFKAGCPPVTHIRFFPRTGQAERMKGGRLTGSNEGPTNGFETLAQIQEAPAEGQWTTLKVEKPALYRFVKYESPTGGWGNVAEIEYFSGPTKLSGSVFGTAGSRDGGGHDFAQAMDGKVESYFEGVEPNGQYVGIDLGARSQAAPVEFSPSPGALKEAAEITLSSATAGAKIRYTINGYAPDRDNGDAYTKPIRLEKPAILAAVAYAEHLAASPVRIAAYRIGQAGQEPGVVRTFHIGNSLTDTVDNWLKPVANSAGKNLDFHRFTIPGAPTDWLWNHPGSGFGDSRYVEAFFVLAPIQHLFTQPFAGHDRSIDNEAEFSGKFYQMCRKHSPEVQGWLYVQWPTPKFNDSWSQGKGSTAPMKLKPATTWQEGVANHTAYTEAVRAKMDAACGGKPILIVPGGPALARLKTEMDAGKVPGMTDFFKETFADDIHLTAKGRYLIALVHYACIYQESPEGKASALTTGLTAEQAKLFQRIAWETVKGYKWAKTSQ